MKGMLGEEVEIKGSGWERTTRGAGAGGGEDEPF